MGRRGRNASPRPAPKGNLSTKARTSSPAVRKTSSPSTAAASKEPSTFQNMAATAGGVAVGSAVGHAIGAGITSLFCGSSDGKEAATTAAATSSQAENGSHPYDDQNPCAAELKQFLQCAQGQADITLCQGFNEALRQCKAKHNLN